MTKFIENKEIKLTPREVEILKVIYDEFTSEEMAEKLSISIATVETHRRNMIKKMGVRNSIGIVKGALSLGLL